MIAIYFTDPTLTTIDQRSKTMDNVVAELFSEHYKTGGEKPVTQKAVLKPELIIRNSTLRKEHKSHL